MQRIEPNFTLRKMIDDYIVLRDDPFESVVHRFWDQIYVTVLDKEQKEAFAEELERKRSKGEIPLGGRNQRSEPLVTFVADSESPFKGVGGNGGSLLNVAAELLKQSSSFPTDDLSKQRILLVMAGGFSKRLPTASLTGKLFMSLPIEVDSKGRSFDMFDLKLALYLPLALHLPYGLWVTCSDDIQNYSFCGVHLETHMASPEKPWILALGHLSSLDIGRHHGVYVLGEKREGPLIECQRVLQKPTDHEMKDSGAIITDGVVCTDSAYLMDMRLVLRLGAHDWLGDGPCDVDAYRDILGPLGLRAPPLQSSASSCVPDRVKCFMQGTPLDILLLPNSTFHHLGTMEEYLEGLCPSGSLFQALGCCVPIASSSFVESAVVVNDATVTCCALLGLTVIEGPSVLEHCILRNVRIPPRTILCHCRAKGPLNVEVPSGFCFHTAVVGKRFVTMAFALNDDLKRSPEGGQLSYSGRSLFDHPRGHNVASTSLFEARLFRSAPTMEEAFAATVEDLDAFLFPGKRKTPGVPNDPELFYSVASIQRTSGVAKDVFLSKQTMEAEIRLLRAECP